MERMTAVYMLATLRLLHSPEDRYSTTRDIYACSNVCTESHREPVVWAVVAQLLQLLLIQILILFLDYTGIAARVLPSIPPPHERVDGGAKTDHAERDSVPTDVPGLVRDRAVRKEQVLTSCSAAKIKHPKRGGGWKKDSLDESRHDSRAVAQRELKACGSRSLSVTWGICR